MLTLRLSRGCDGFAGFFSIVTGEETPDFILRQFPQLSGLQ